MRTESLEELLAAAQARVRGVRARLARPRTCNPDECVTLLREAQGYLEWLRDSLAGAAPHGQLRVQAVALCREISEAGILLERAARFGHRWLENLRVRHCGYTGASQPGPLPPGGCFSLVG